MKQTVNHGLQNVHQRVILAEEVLGVIYHLVMQCADQFPQL